MFVSKRVLWLIGVVVVLVMLAAGIGLVYAFNALTQQKTTNANLSATVTAQTLAPTPTLLTTGQRRVVGVVQTIGTQSFTIAVTTKKAKRVLTVNVDAETKYVHSGKAAAFSDLQAGEDVVVLGTLDAKSLSIQATRVTLSPKAAAPAPGANPTATATPAP